MKTGSVASWISQEVALPQFYIEGDRLWLHQTYIGLYIKTSKKNF